MKKLITILMLSLSTNFALAEEKPEHYVPVKVVKGHEMPETEAELLKKYGNVPVLFKGAALGWPAMEWTPENLSEKFGEFTVSNGLDYSLKDYFKDIEKNDQTYGSNPTLYYYLGGAFSYNHTCEYESRLEKCLYDFEVKRDLDPMYNTRFPELPLENGPLDDWEFKGHDFHYFIGPRGTVTYWHNHGQVFLSQLYGKKRLLMVDPKYSALCSWDEYQHDFDESKPADYKRVYTGAGCLYFSDSEFTSKYPELKKLKVHEAILEPGDVLYIPYYWLHLAQSLTTSVSMAYGF